MQFPETESVNDLIVVASTNETDTTCILLYVLC